MRRKTESERQLDWIEEIALTAETLISDESHKYRPVLVDLILQYVRVLDRHVYVANKRRLGEVKNRVALLTEHQDLFKRDQSLVG